MKKPAPTASRQKTKSTPDYNSVSSLRWVLINRAAALTGYSENAIRHMVKNGTWAQGRIWRKVGGRIFINMEEVERWVENAPQTA
ncbi:hypothetical protein D9M71_419040 [compost metagenome]